MVVNWVDWHWWYLCVLKPWNVQICVFIWGEFVRAKNSSAQHFLPTLSHSLANWLFHVGRAVIYVLPTFIAELFAKLLCKQQNYNEPIKVVRLQYTLVWWELHFRPSVAAEKMFDGKFRAVQVVWFSAKNITRNGENVLFNVENSS